MIRFGMNSVQENIPMTHTQLMRNILLLAISVKNNSS